MTPAPELVFVNDGPAPADRERLMISAGEVIQGEFGSNRASYRATLAMAARRGFDDADLVWFAEDDYLYTPDAFEHLVRTAERLSVVKWPTSRCTWASSHVARHRNSAMSTVVVTRPLRGPARSLRVGCRL